MNSLLLASHEISSVASPAAAGLRAPRKNFIPELDTINLGLADMKITTDESKTASGRIRKTSYLEVDGTQFLIGDRFRNSILGHIGQGNSIFNLFEIDEVMNRFRDKVPTREAVSVTLDLEGRNALGVVQNGKPIAAATEIADLTLSQGASFRYFGGRILAEHTPGNEFEAQARLIGGEVHNLKYYHDCPLDGYGNPSFFIGLIRQICSNGAVAMAPAFRKSLNLPDPRKIKGGNDAPSVIGTIERALRNFSIGEEASSGLIERIEAAGKTPASVREFRNMLRTFERILDPSSPGCSETSRMRIRYAMDGIKDAIINDLDVTSLSVFDDKPASRIPTPYNVYDLINMATEAVSHFDLFNDTVMHGAVGRLLVESYDLEGLDLPVPDCTPFFFLDKDEQLELVTLN